MADGHPRDHSRALAGYTVSLDAPSALQTALALRPAIWRKRDPAWPVCGIPGVLYSDHGRTSPAAIWSRSASTCASIGRLVIDDYHARAHSETRQAPRERWLAGGWLPQMPQSLERLDLLLLTVAKPRVVQRDGIRFQGVRYLDLTLAAYVGEPVTIRYDPRDLAEIRVYHHSRAERPQREVLGGRGMTYAGHIFALSRSGA